jgi:hypothetical protein
MSGIATAGFDIVTAISQDTVNYQIQQLFKQGVLPNSWNITMADTGISIDATLSPPTVNFAVPDSTSTVVFAINMPSGVFTYYEGFGPSAQQQKLQFSNWSYAFNVNLNFAQISADDIQNSTAVPDVVKTTLSAFQSDMFTIQHLFMDFENADIASYNPNLTSMPVPGASGLTPGQLTQWQNAIEDYFKSLSGTSNPYILGYVASTANTSVQDGAPPLFNPTGATFSTFQGAATSGANTLNFLLMTDGAAIPPVPPNGVLTASPISSSDYDGAMVVDPSVFVEGFVVEQLLADVSAAAGLGPFTQSGPGWLASASSNNLDQHGGKGAVVGSDSKILDIYLEQRNSATATAAIVTGSTPSIHIAGAFEIDAGYYEYPFGSRTWDGTVKTTLNWTLDIAISAGTDGTIVVTPTFNPSAPTQDKSENFIQKILDVIGQGMNGFLDQVGAWASQIESYDFSGMQSSLTNALSMLSTRVILPAGDVFFFSDASLLGDYTLHCDLQYKASH